MRTLRRNKTKLWYSLYKGKEVAYLKDENGQIIFEDIDGEQVPIETGYNPPTYQAPVEFGGYIQFSGGEGEAESFGVSADSYSHILIMRKDEIPIDETSLIFKAEPQTVSEETADFKVTRVAESLNFVTYLLRAKDADH